jgi:hypothetical protein
LSLVIYVDQVVVTDVYVSQVVDDAGAREDIALDADFTKFVTEKESKVIQGVHGQIRLFCLGVHVDESSRRVDAARFNHFGDMILFVPFYIGWHIKNIRSRNLRCDKKYALACYRW